MTDTETDLPEFSDPLRLSQRERVAWQTVYDFLQLIDILQSHFALEELQTAYTRFVSCIDDCKRVLDDKVLNVAARNAWVERLDDLKNTWSFVVGTSDLDIVREACMGRAPKHPQIEISIAEHKSAAFDWKRELNRLLPVDMPLETSLSSPAKQSPEDQGLTKETSGEEDHSRQMPSSKQTDEKHWLVTPLLSLVGVLIAGFVTFTAITTTRANYQVHANSTEIERVRTEIKGYQGEIQADIKGVSGELTGVEKELGGTIKAEVLKLENKIQKNADAIAVNLRAIERVESELKDSFKRLFEKLDRLAVNPGRVGLGATAEGSAAEALAAADADKGALQQ